MRAKAGMTAALAFALALPFTPLAHAAGGFSPYPWGQLRTTQELQTPNYRPIPPSSHQLFPKWAKPHWLRRQARQQ